MPRRSTRVVLVCAALAAGLLGCSGGTPEAVTPIFQAEVSGCGGFAQQGSLLLAAESVYCDAEVLHWRYEPATRRLTLVDARVILNCCGDRSVGITLSGDTLRLQEQDAPAADQGRCRCSCAFDFEAVVERVAEDLLPIQLWRETTDDGGGARLLFADRLDLSLGSGFEVIDETEAGGSCE